MTAPAKQWTFGLIFLAAVVLLAIIAIILRFFAGPASDVRVAPIPDTMFNVCAVEAGVTAGASMTGEQRDSISACLKKMGYRP
jgi:hypothetical protein